MLMSTDIKIRARHHARRIAAGRDAPLVAAIVEEAMLEARSEAERLAQEVAIEWGRYIDSRDNELFTTFNALLSELGVTLNESSEA